MGQRYVRGGNVKVPLYQRANRRLPPQFRMERNTWQFALVATAVTLISPVFTGMMYLIAALAK